MQFRGCPAAISTKGWEDTGPRVAGLRRGMLIWSEQHRQQLQTCPGPHKTPTSPARLVPEVSLFPLLRRDSWAREEKGFAEATEFMGTGPRREVITRGILHLGQHTRGRPDTALAREVRDRPAHCPLHS